MAVDYSIAVTVALLGVSGYWAWKTGRLADSFGLVKTEGNLRGAQQTYGWVMIPRVYGNKHFQWNYKLVSEDGSFMWLHLKGIEGAREFWPMPLVNGAPPAYALHPLNAATFDVDRVWVLETDDTRRDLPVNFEKDAEAMTMDLLRLRKNLELSEREESTDLDRIQDIKNAQKDVGEHVLKYLKFGGTTK